MVVEKLSGASTSAPVPTEVGVTPAKVIGEDSKESTSTTSSDEKGYLAKIKDHEFLKRCWKVITWTPKRCRWDPEDPPKFSMGLNLLFGFVSVQNFVDECM
jgi:hypothetical protein